MTRYPEIVAVLPSEYIPITLILSVVTSLIDEISATEHAALIPVHVLDGVTGAGVVGEGVGVASAFLILIVAVMESFH